MANNKSYKSLLLLIVITILSITSARKFAHAGPGGWEELPNTQLSAQCPEDGFNGATFGTLGGEPLIYDFSFFCSSVTEAWSGASFDTSRNRLYIWGGGHKNYLGNEIYALDLNNTPSMIRLTDPATPLDHDSNPSELPPFEGTQPRSRETYDGMVYLPGPDKLWSWSGSLATSGFPDGVTWLFDPSSNTWQRQTPSGDIPFENIGAISAYDPNTGAIYLHNLQNLFRYTYNSSGGTYTQLTMFEAGYYVHMNGVIDPKRNKFILIGRGANGEGQSIMYDISADSDFQFETINAVGDTQFLGAEAPGLAYDPVIEKVVAWAGGDTVYILDLDTTPPKWTAESYPVQPPRATEAPIAHEQGTYGRFEYAPAMQAFVLYNETNKNGYLFRWPDTDNDGIIDKIDTDENIAPTVDAGANQSITLASDAILDATLSDDGQAGTLSTLWTVNSGPGIVNFGDDTQIDTTASFSQDGIYELNLSANDGELTTNDQVIITVNADSANLAPIVVAGFSQSITLPDNVLLDGTVDDDGEPISPGVVTTLWSVVSGPGTVVFADDAKIDTTASFSQEGIYELSLSANDGELTTDDTTTITVNAASVSNDLLGHWKLDDGDGSIASDSSGNENAGAVNGAVWTVNGFLNGALEFDGVNDFVDIGRLDIPGNSMTISAWINADTFTHLRGRDARIVSKATGTATQSHYWMLSTIKQGSDTALRFRLKTNDTTKTLISSSSVLTTGTWLHIAAVYDGTQMRLYQNGVQIGSTSKTGLIDQNPAVQVWIGQNPAGSRPFDGLIDDVQIHSRALSAVEIAALANPNPDGSDNLPPTISAGIDQTITLPNDAILNGTVNDDGKPNPPGAMTTLWTKVSGPGTVNFQDNTSVNTSASFNQAGTYELSLSANDSESISDDQISITVNSANNSGDLVGHWTLDEGNGGIASDNSGNGNDGTVNGANWTNNGMINGALDFDGQNDHIVIGKLDVPGDKMTISAWIKADSFSHLGGRDARIVSKATGTATQSHYWMLSTIKQGSDTALRFRLKTNGSTKTLIASSNVLTTGNWFHIAAVYNGSQMRLYQNGVEVGRTTKTGTIAQNADVSAWIGRNPGSKRPFDGIIDDVKIYNQALSADEISVLMNGS